MNMPNEFYYYLVWNKTLWNLVSWPTDCLKFNLWKGKKIKGEKKENVKIWAHGKEKEGSKTLLQVPDCPIVCWEHSHDLSWFILLYEDRIVVKKELWSCSVMQLHVPTTDLISIED